MIWDFVKIDDVSHWLPVSADFSWRMGDGSLTRAAAMYKKHRHFAATRLKAYWAAKKKAAK